MFTPQALVPGKWEGVGQTHKSLTWDRVKLNTFQIKKKKKKKERYRAIPLPVMAEGAVQVSELKIYTDRL